VVCAIHPVLVIIVSCLHIQTEAFLSLRHLKLRGSIVLDFYRIRLPQIFALPADHAWDGLRLVSSSAAPSKPRPLLLHVQILARLGCQVTIPFLLSRSPNLTFVVLPSICEFDITYLVSSSHLYEERMNLPEWWDCSLYCISRFSFQNGAHRDESLVIRCESKDWARARW
jgi:hypothetical protein